MATNTPILKAAIYLIKCGYKKEARPLLFNLLDQNPADEVAFLWYVDTIRDIRDRIYTMEDFLDDYPGSIYAQTGLMNLRNQYRLYGPEGKPFSPYDEQVDFARETGRDDERFKSTEEQGDEFMDPGRVDPYFEEETFEEGTNEGFTTRERGEENLSSGGKVDGHYTIEEDSNERLSSQDSYEEVAGATEPPMEHAIESETWQQILPPEDLDDGSIFPDTPAEVLAADDAMDEQFTTAEKAGDWYSFADDHGEEYMPPEPPSEALDVPEPIEERLGLLQARDEQEYIPDWLKEAHLSDNEGKAVERIGNEPPPNEIDPHMARKVEEPADETVRKDHDHISSPDNIIAGMISAGHSAPTKRPNQASPDEIVQRLRKGGESPPQGGGPPLPKKLSAKEPLPRKKLRRVLEIIAIFLICCVGLTIIAYFAQPLLFGSVEKQYAIEMEPVLLSIDDWMNGPITSWNQVLDEQVYTNQSTTYRDLLSEQMAAGRPDEVVKGRLLPIAKEVITQGTTILEKMDAITVPTGIGSAQRDVSGCIQYEIEYMANIVNFLQYNIATDIGPSRCGNYTTTYDEIRRFIDTNK